MAKTTRTRQSPPSVLFPLCKELFRNEAQEAKYKSWNIANGPYKTRDEMPPLPERSIFGIVRVCVRVCMYE